MHKYVNNYLTEIYRKRTSVIYSHIYTVVRQNFDNKNQQMTIKLLAQNYLLLWGVPLKSMVIFSFCDFRIAFQICMLENRIAAIEFTQYYHKIYIKIITEYYFEHITSFIKKHSFWRTFASSAE